MDDTPQGPPLDDDERAVRLDALSVRGLAHPIRLKMLGLLRTDGPATATSLARQLGLNTGATSYHLRQLAAYGFIVEDSGRGTTRERWWRAAHRSTYFDRNALTGDETGEAFVRAIGQIYSEKIQRAIDEYATLPPEWRDAGTLSDTMLMLTPDESTRLVSELFEVMARYRRHDPDHPSPAPADATPVTLQLQVFPDASKLADAEPPEETG
ncbi:ArsR family transcriptional regulator [Actinobacteria bacterium YIM 96077]|uniref:ArsR family transcriptional regulator n=1 Tax=Phytoactinopolyspora halophila TaxID=1981511 RepID=A0A329QW00_9ACTN|nr:helix-turn-helix domain-containing protein [Phytoactinopolyspora halophila]AYY12875.1 ArsR family transcriptional regulator [Actinobacteria bacterium YIM 96077]RAW16331.1 ArsR family transcriptional regulator [Phytoactinopolyspora halophila]